MTDRFPEAFRRFEDDVDVRDFESFRQLEIAFGYWAGRRWRPTYKQKCALAREARRLGISEQFRGRNYRFSSSPNLWYRYETVSVKGRMQQRFRDVRTGRFIKKP